MAQRRVAVPEADDQRSERRVARKMIASYHEQQLRLLLERVHEGFAALEVLARAWRT
jgi:hypothetical protein